MPITKADLIKRFNEQAKRICSETQHDGQVGTFQMTFENFVNGRYKLGEENNKNFIPKGNFGENLTDKDVVHIWIEYSNTTLSTLMENSKTSKLPFVSPNAAEKIMDALGKIYAEQQSPSSSSTAAPIMHTSSSSEQSPAPNPAPVASFLKKWFG